MKRVASIKEKKSKKKKLGFSQSTLFLGEKRAKSKIDNIFGSKILLDEETALIKSQLTKQQAENWIKNAYEIREIFQYAGLNPHDVMGILR